MKNDRQQGNDVIADDVEHQSSNEFDLPGAREKAREGDCT